MAVPTLTKEQHSTRYWPTSRFHTNITTVTCFF